MKPGQKHYFSEPEMYFKLDFSSSLSFRTLFVTDPRTTDIFCRFKI